VVRPWAVSVPRIKTVTNGVHQGYKIPFIVVNINGRPVKMLLDSAGSSDMLSHKSARVCGLHNFPKACYLYQNPNYGIQP